jgi:hypothetical protein
LAKNTPKRSGENIMSFRIEKWALPGRINLGIGVLGRYQQSAFFIGRKIPMTGMSFGLENFSACDISPLPSCPCGILSINFMPRRGRRGNTGFGQS